MSEDRIILKKKQLDTQLTSMTLFHSSLEIPTILQHFSRDLKNHLDYESIHYHHPLLKNGFNLGQNAKYQSNYDLTIEKRSLGEITFTRKKPFRSNDIDTLESQLCLLINPLNNAITHHQALHAALHDPLTTLLNRGSLPNVLKREIQMAKRYKKGLASIILDIDNFKHINDKYGHLVGDQILSQTALIIQSTIRETDYAFRIGGEEFLILIVNSTIKGSKLLSERLRSNIEMANLLDKNPSLPKVTASIGLTRYQPPETQQSLISRADKAMYQAKTKGKNQVVFA